MVHRFAKVSEEIVAINEAAFFYQSDLVNTEITIPLRVGEEQWIYTSTLRVSVCTHCSSPTLRGIVLLRVSVYIHHYSPPLRRTVVYYFEQH